MNDEPRPTVAKTHQLRMARLARIEHRLADINAEAAALCSEKARLYDELAEGTSVDLRTGRKKARPHVPALGEISELDRARARAALNQLAERQRRTR